VVQNGQLENFRIRRVRREGSSTAATSSFGERKFKVESEDEKEIEEQVNLDKDVMVDSKESESGGCEGSEDDGSEESEDDGSEGSEDDGSEESEDEEDEEESRDEGSERSENEEVDEESENEDDEDDGDGEGYEHGVSDQCINCRSRISGSSANPEEHRHSKRRRVYPVTNNASSDRRRHRPTLVTVESSPAGENHDGFEGGSHAPTSSIPLQQVTGRNEEKKRKRSRDCGGDHANGTVARVSPSRSRRSRTRTVKSEDDDFRSATAEGEAVERIPSGCRHRPESVMPCELTQFPSSPLLATISFVHPILQARGEVNHDTDMTTSSLGTPQTRSPARSPADLATDASGNLEPISNH
jgi:hypothetical protein